MKTFTKSGLMVVMALGVALPAGAVKYSAVGLGFEGLQVPTSGTYLRAQVWQYYDGGFSRSEDGLTDLVQGPDDYDVAFNDRALALRSAAANGTGSFGPRFLDSQGGPQLTDLGDSALFFASGDVVLNYGSGFNKGFSFYYASTADLTITLYDGFDGSGSSLGSGSFNATPTCTLEDNSYCAWSVGAIAFSGTVKSVRFGGLQNQALFDNVSFGSLTPFVGAVPVPEPSTWALAALGLAIVAGVARRRRVSAS